jgi:hypothetical protein
MKPIGKKAEGVSVGVADWVGAGVLERKRAVTGSLTGLVISDRVAQLPISNTTIKIAYRFICCPLTLVRSVLGDY